MSDKSFKPYVGQDIPDTYLQGLNGISYIRESGEVVYVGRHYCVVEPDDRNLLPFVVGKEDYDYLKPKESSQK